MSRHKKCVARIQLAFGKKTELRRKLKQNPKLKFGEYKSFCGNATPENIESVYNRIAQSVSVALKPPQSFSSTYSSPCPSFCLFRSSFERDPSRDTSKVFYDDNSNVYIDIESDDIPTLRASINSYLRLADASHRCISEEKL